MSPSNRLSAMAVVLTSGGRRIRTTPAYGITETPVGPSVAAGAPEPAPKLMVSRSHVADGSQRISVTDDASPVSSPSAAMRPSSPNGRSPAMQSSLLGGLDVVVIPTVVVVVSSDTSDSGEHAETSSPRATMASNRCIARPYPRSRLIIESAQGPRVFQTPSA